MCFSDLSMSTDCGYQIRTGYLHCTFKQKCDIHPALKVNVSLYSFLLTVSTFIYIFFNKLALPSLLAFIVHL